MVTLLIAAVAAFVAGVLLAWSVESSRGRSKIAVLEQSAKSFQLRWAEAHEALEQTREKLEKTAKGISEQQAEIARLEERNAADKRASDQLVEQMKSSLPDTFKALAGAVLDEKSKAFAEQNQANLGQMLAPLSVKLEDFQRKIEEAHLQQVRGGAELREQVKTMIDSTTNISEQANNLAQALRGSSKMQGMWGELILERALESAGLRRGFEYEAQESYASEGGRRAVPDVVIHLPGGRHLIVDSKVSLVDYDAHHRAENDAARSLALSGHLNSVRSHIKELSEKNYQSLYGLNSLDFVIMFLPIDSAFILALNADEKLLDRAWKQNVLLVSPSTFLFVVRTVDHLWRQEQQKRSVEEIASKGADLYNKLAGFVADLTEVGARLDRARESYDNALAKLSTGRGNVIRQAEMLKTLGVKASKELPQGLVERAQQEDLDLETPENGS